MTLISKEKLSEIAGLSKIPIPGLPSYLMKVMKINNLNTVVKEAGNLEGADFANYVLKEIGVDVQFDVLDAVDEQAQAVGRAGIERGPGDDQQPFGVPGGTAHET